MLAGLLFASPAATASDVGPGGDVAFSGQVIERETGKPVAGAEILLERSIRGSTARTPPAWAGASLIRTDAQGRFRVEFPAETGGRAATLYRAADQPSRVHFPEIEPGCAHRADPLAGKGRGSPFSRQSRSSEDSSTPARSWCPGASRRPVSRTRSNTGRAEPAVPYPSSRTITRGRPTTTAASACGCRRLTRWPSSWVRRAPPGRDSPSLPISTSGVPRPPPGTRMSGPRPTSAGSCCRAGSDSRAGWSTSEDRPIAGQTITAYPLRGRDRHSTTTEADGTFALGPLRPANYLIYGEGQSPYCDVDFDAPSASPTRPCRPAGASLFSRRGRAPEPLVLRELPTVRVELRFVDSKGKPARGSTTRLSGSAPGRSAPARVFPVPAYAMREGPTSALNAPEPEDRWEPTSWGMCRTSPTTTDGSSFMHPRACNRATWGTARGRDDGVQAPDRPQWSDPAGAARAPGRRRRRPSVNHHRVSGADRARLREDGGRCASRTDLSVIARYRIDSQIYGSRFVRQPDGRLSQPEPDARS